MKEVIVSNALKIFSIKGYYGTSMSDVSKAVDLHKSSLYNYFKSKGEIFEACIEECMKRACHHIDSFEFTHQTNKNDFLKFLKKFLFDDISYIRFYFQMSFSPECHKKAIFYWKDKLRKTHDTKLKSILEFLGFDSLFEEFRISINNFINGWLTSYLFNGYYEGENIIVTEFEIHFEIFYQSLVSKIENKFDLEID
ncbi:TetR/AcrR family transcriptional regulator [Staphylococcus gallinarum]|uniref:TetR/AcrR family transcriptional regulator n=1 Tax=Staphylococcus gallinarum TaxID=1293 RepID=UPI002DBE3812|nr:TetR/AcrR family transcriptional regulator [Staphylococcus gallinarum]MEB7040080.1 TetR/AcrR family transcriptional regulator [Staphylococcus gallinarum]